MDHFEAGSCVLCVVCVYLLISRYEAIVGIFVCACACAYVNVCRGYCRPHTRARSECFNSAGEEGECEVCPRLLHSNR